MDEVRDDSSGPRQDRTGRFRGKWLRWDEVVVESGDVKVGGVIVWKWGVL